MIKVSMANKGSRVITTTKFKNYDVCLNPYVGCQFGCKYCYVRFFVKDDEKPWGEFVRLRKHIATRLPVEIAKGTLDGKRLVIGTMTDPYQPVERKERLTRLSLELIRDLDHKPSKVGIFTRSPIVLDDLGLIAGLPRVRVHFTVTPFSPEIMQRIEPLAIRTDRRIDTIKKIKAAGIRTHINVSPALPILSDGLVEKYAEMIGEIGVSEFYVDPMQCYGPAYEATATALKDLPQWFEISDILSDETRYSTWKSAFRDSWITAWKKYGKPETMAIWQDHESGLAIDMKTGETLNWKRYGDDAEP